MDKFDATEHAYVNGYSSGYEAGRRSVGIPNRIKAVVDIGASVA